MVKLNQKITVKHSRHCLGTLITNNPKILMDAESCNNFMEELLEELKVVSLGTIVHEFQNKSFTILVALAESHISIHTWPERHAIQLDVFLCNYLHDNTELCEKIFNTICDYFKPVETNLTLLERI